MRDRIFNSFRRNFICGFKTSISSLCAANIKQKSLIETLSIIRTVISYRLANN